MICDNDASDDSGAAGQGFVSVSSNYSVGFNSEVAANNRSIRGDAVFCFHLCSGAHI
jgi:hypothetical protein